MKEEISEFFEMVSNVPQKKCNFCLLMDDGSSVIILGDTLDVFSDPITGIDENGCEVRIPQSEVKKVD